MVKIRLTRLGAKKKPFYRVVVAESRNARNGEAIANIGYYNPMTDPAEIKIDVDAAKDWIAKGAQPTETVKRLLKIAGLE
jgi:small subunit ribosomal protein S16